MGAFKMQVEKNIGVRVEYSDEDEVDLKDSLLKYDNPVMLTNKGKYEVKKPLKVSSKVWNGNIEDFDDERENKENKFHGEETLFDESMSTSDILDYLLPPKQWSEKDCLWIQKVSSTPSTRQEVINLETELDKKLNEKKAKLAGICPVRRQLFHQCFDELIRQVTINCAERGQLLLRVRDELFCTLKAFETLYESSISFGLRKALQSEESAKKLDDMTSDLSAENEKLKLEVVKLKEKMEQSEVNAAENKQIEERKHNDEVQFLKRTNQQLKSQIEAIISAKKQ